MSLTKLPVAWSQTTLGEVCEKVKQGKPLADFDYIDIESVNNKLNVVECPKRLSPRTAPSRARKPVQAGDVIFSTVRPYLKNIALVPRLTNPVASTGFCVLRSSTLSSAFIFNYVRSPSFLKLMESKQRGASYPAVSDAVVFSAPVPVPPKQEQARIVAKIESCFSRIDAIEESVTKAQSLLESYKASLLAKAFRGELIAQDPNDEPASKLLERIRAERAKANAGKKSTKDDLLSVTADEIPYEIPKSWAFARLSELGEFCGGMTPATGNDKFWTGDIPWVSPKDMKQPLICDSIDHISTQALEVTRLRLLPIGSLLFVVRGMILAHSFPIALTTAEVTINQDIKALTPSREIDERYLFWAMTAAKNAVLETVKTASHGTKRLEPGTLEDWLVPIAPRTEQNRIVEKIERMMASFERVSSDISKVEQAKERIENSILDSAFRGNLVPQISSEGTGHDLLAQLNPAQAAESPKPAKKKGKSKS